MNYSEIYNHLSSKLGSSLSSNPEILKGLIEDHKPLFELCTDKNFKDRCAHLETSINQFGQSKVDVVVVGSGNHGKSTLVNALVGQVVARTSFLPNTWCIHRYKQGPEHLATVRFRCGKEQQCSHEEASAIWDIEEKKAVSNPEYFSKVLEIDWQSPLYLTLNEFNVVDTPGLNQQRMSVHDNIDLEDYYFKAGLVLWAVRSDKINEKTTIESIKKVGRYNKKVIVVLTRWDSVSDKQAVFSEAINYYNENIIVPVSALQAIKNYSSLDSNIDSLKDELSGFVNNEYKAKFVYNLYDEFKLSLNEAISYLKEEKKRINHNEKVNQSKIKCVNVFLNTFLGSGIDIPSLTRDKIYDFMLSQIMKINHKNVKPTLDMLFNDDYLGKKSKVLEITVNETLRKIISALASDVKSQKYHLNKYDYCGNIESSAVIDEDIRESSISFKIEKPNIAVSKSFSDSIYEWVPDFFLIFTDIFLPGHREKKVQELRSEVRSQVLSHKNNLDQCLTNQIQNRFDSKLYSLKNSIETYYENSIVKTKDAEILKLSKSLISGSKPFVLKNFIFP